MTSRFYSPERGSLVGARRTEMSGRRPGGRVSAVLAALGLGVVLFNSWAACSRMHRQRLSSRPQTLPEKLQTWEGEGGGLVEGSHQPEPARPAPTRPS